MKFNRNLLTYCVLTILLFSSIFTLTSCANKQEDTNTDINNSTEDANSLDNNTQDSNLDKNEANVDNNINKDETANNDNNEMSTSDKKDDSNVENENSTVDESKAPDKVESITDNTIDDMKINEDGIYAINNHIFKSIYPLDEKSVIKAANYIKNLKETYFTENNKVFYAVVPDKTYYDSSSSYDKLDYDKLVDILNENIDNIEYIKIKDLLSLDDYYKTDNHWRQEKIIDIANRIGEKLNFKIDVNSFKNESYSSFKGMYSKYIKNTSFREELQYLTNDAIINASVENYQNKDFKNVYDIARLTTNISYDVFLSGASPFITITNTSATSNKELVIFRDSFASSLAPLLISEYNKITLIDTRYMMSFLLKDFIEFNNQDILFLYSSALLNNSAILK